MLSAVIDSLSAVHRMLPTVFGILSAANQVCCQRLNDKGVHMSIKNKKGKNNKEVEDNIDNFEEGSLELYTGELVPNSNNTVQPIALMRLGLFVPTLKGTKYSKRNKPNEIDASKELVQLEVARSEGYSDIKITGPRLDMDHDFKTWVGVVRSLAEYGEPNGRVELSITKFAKFCGYPSSQIRKTLRDRLTNSLLKIMRTTLSFQRTYEEKNVDGSNKISLLMVHLINSVDYNEQKDTVVFYAEPKLAELYRFDHKVLLQLKVINKLPRKETAQALYTFIESLPTKPAPVSLARLRARLNLSSRNVSSQNQTIRNGLKALQDLGYLEYSEIKRGRSIYIQIHSRNPKLKVAPPKPEDIEPKKPDEKAGEIDAKQNIINKITELSQNLTPENIKMIEILSNSLKLL
ncbi:TPA: RepB family plasmid replication initiator protein [Escherichia coli]|uniref:RepB family plasmid replication initiator protein n=1 Tax=Escherichia coli TaxID=562 RepID=UPI0014824AFC|nr:RepB family plasmid replication initiator protein [Escherichia coli]EEZ6178699.1 RepB family plasmid replication initiator protein [Escherichia coli O65]EHC2668785.1 RepB family plasmid replication initiator protein [Escherichia coli]QML54495.1 RepB family plasmid replication initiator protein [Escherichia coli]HBB3007374.1 RepB family plasmid replication initiator protein [Escherichia coli]